MDRRQSCARRAPGLLLGLLIILIGAEVSAQSIRVAVETAGRQTGQEVADQLNDDTHFDFEATVVTATQVDSVEELSAYDVVILGDAGFNDNDHSLQMAEALTEWMLEHGGGVVTAGWFDYSTNADAIDTALDNITPIDASPFGYNFCGSGATIRVSDPSHEITAGLPETFTLTTSNTEFSHLPPDSPEAAILGTVEGGGCTSNQNPKNVIVAGEEGTGRSVYLGLLFMAASTYNNAGLRSGAPDQLLEQAVAWAASGASQANAGGRYIIDEGTASITLDASRSRGDVILYLWDFNNDGVFDDADGETVEFDTSELDGPSEITVGLRITNIDNENFTAEARIIVNNVSPVITSTPPEQASINNLYAYPFAIEDPAGALDPPLFTLIEGPEGVTFDVEGVMSWTPGPEHFEQTINFHVQVDDGDGGLAEQSWSLFITAPDEDGDRIPDEDDNCPLVPNVDQLDNDMDSIGDLCDGDDDNDEVLDINDNCRFFPNPDQADNDGTEGGDACDDDDDNDFVPDVDDNCPFVTNPSQADSDNDGIGDACAGDGDRDSIPDENDNCPLIRNTDQLDTDDDGLGDVCDDDDDDDGLSDEDEAIAMTDPLNPDTDGDRLRDGREAAELGTDPLDPDTDGDGIGDGDEVLDHGTNPLAPDSDDDGLDDGLELNTLGTDPLDPDTDGDGLTDGDEVDLHLTDPNSADSDNGSVSDGDEITNGTDPNNPIDDIPVDPEPDANFNNDSFPEPDADDIVGSLDTDESCACTSVSRPASGSWALGLGPWALIVVGFLWRRRKTD